MTVILISPRDVNKTFKNYLSESRVAENQIVGVLSECGREFLSKEHEKSIDRTTFRNARKTKKDRGERQKMNRLGRQNMPSYIHSREG